MLLSLSYLILVLIVGFGAYWVQYQFDKAEHQRCELLVVQVRLAEVQVILLREGTPPPAPAVRAQIEDQITAMKDRFAQSCPDTALPQ